LQRFWKNEDIWNRLNSDGGADHETPIVGVVNYAYVRVKNRGTQEATNVVVKGYHCNPGAGLTWPNDWQPMQTAQLNGANVPANNAGEIIVGPFEWIPSQPDHECMLMIVSATGDASNVDNFGVGESIPEWRLVPHDNNIGQRNVAPVPAGGGVQGFKDAFSPMKFWVHNSFRQRKDKVEIEIILRRPKSLVTAEWTFKLSESKFSLAHGQKSKIEISIDHVGNDIVINDPADVTIEVEVLTNGILVGGVSYYLDPNMAKLPEQNLVPIKPPIKCPCCVIL